VKHPPYQERWPAGNTVVDERPEAAGAVFEAILTPAGERIIKLARGAGKTGPIEAPPCSSCCK